MNRRTVYLGKKYSCIIYCDKSTNISATEHATINERLRIFSQVVQNAKYDMHFIR